MINNKNISDNLFIKFLNENKLNCELTEKDIINDYNNGATMQWGLISHPKAVSRPRPDIDSDNIY